MLGKKGQTALEYLMTYGWALVVIVIVIAALVILVGPTTGADSCSGSIKFTVPSVRDSGNNLVLTVTNATGQSITSVVLNFTNTSGADINAPVSGTWTAGTTKTGTSAITLTGAVTSGSAYTVPVKIYYTDQYSNPKTETVTCSGTAD